MPGESAFARRLPGTNPIALELDRLAEQRALNRLGAPPPNIGRLGVPARRTDPSLTTGVVSGETPPELSPSPLASGSDLAEAYMDAMEGLDPNDPEQLAMRDAFIRSLGVTR